MKQSVAIFDFGTSKITVLVGRRGINDSICIDGIGRCEYAGYSGGKWLDAERLASAVSHAISSAESSARVQLDKLYIGVPNDFSLCRINDAAISLSKKRRVTEQDVIALRDSANLYENDPDWTVINIQPIYFTLDDDRKLVEPVGMTSTKLGGSLSYLLARKDFIEIVDAAINSAGIAETEYVSSSLAEILFLFDDYKRDNCVMLADVGAIGTSLSIGRGDGVCRQYYFSWGGARITSAIAEKLGISPKEAELLKRQVILSLEPDYVPTEDTEPILMQTEYEVEIDNEIKTFDVSQTNLIVRLEIERLARYIEKALKNCDYDYPEFTPLSITGGGLNYIRGAAEYLSECLNREVNRVESSLPMLDRPQLSSALGLLDMVLSSEQPPSGLIDRFRRWLSKR
ncbi:MAG: hypothetical protein J1G01_03570 [Clostridiales bacterium]|nr:hypothetical protein [Clostridiales bacterium]